MKNKTTVYETATTQFSAKMYEFLTTDFPIHEILRSRTASSNSMSLVFSTFALPTSVLLLLQLLLPLDFGFFTKSPKKYLNRYRSCTTTHDNGNCNSSAQQLASKHRGIIPLRKKTRKWQITEISGSKTNAVNVESNDQTRSYTSCFLARLITGKCNWPLKIMSNSNSLWQSKTQINHYVI